MRRIFFILSICMALAACDDVPVAGEGMVHHVLALDADLVRYDSIMQSRPDSALVLLLSYPAQKEDETLSDSLSVKNDGINAFAAMLNRNYFYLLVSEALFKTDNMQTVRPQVQQAECFFDSLAMQHPDNDDITFLSARSHYMNGVGFYENDSVVEACKEYLNALEIMEAHFNEDELVGQKAKFMALSYTRLTELFSDHYLHEQAIAIGFQSLKYFRKFDSQWNISWILETIASHYDMLQVLDSAEYYYNEAILALPDTSHLLYRDILTQLSFLSYRKYGLSENSYAELYRLMRLSESTQEYIARRSVIGTLFYREQQYDSAFYCLYNVFHKSDDVALKVKAAEMLQHICQAKEFGDANDYALFRSKYATDGTLQSTLHSRLMECYSSFYMDKEVKNHMQKNKMFMMIGKIIIIMLILFTVILSILHIINRIKFEHKIVEQNKKYYLLNKTLESERSNYKINQATLSGRLKSVNAALKEQKKRLNTNVVQGISIDDGAKKTVANYIDEPICSKIISVCNDVHNPIKSTVPTSLYKSISLNHKQLAELKKAALTHYKSLFEMIKQQYPELKEKDYVYCYLALLGLDNVQISAMLQNSVSTIWAREKHLQSIFKSDDKIVSILNGLVISL